MNDRRPIIVVAILALTLACAAADLQVRPVPEYQGRALSDWVVDLRSTNGQVRDMALAALRQTPAQSVPLLLAELQCRDPWLKRTIWKLIEVQPSLRMGFVTADRRHRVAFDALRKLKPYSKATIDALTGHLIATNTGISALNTLIDVGRRDLIDNPDLIPALVVALRSLDPVVRRTAAAEMRRLPKDRPEVVAALQQACRDPDQSVRHSAGWTLKEISNDPSTILAGWMAHASNLSDPRSAVDFDCLVPLGPRAAPAIPLVMKLADDRSANTVNDVFGRRQVAIITLGRIACEAERVIPFLVNKLHDEDFIVRRNAAYALAAFGMEATNAVPPLIRARDDSAECVREAASYALDHICPRPDCQSSER